MFQINKILKNKDINPFLWFFSPILITLIIFIVKFLNINFFISYFKGESGIIENGTFLVLFFSIIITFSVLNKLKKNINLKNLYFIIIVFLIGLIYFTGEEISWGQQWFDWETNEFGPDSNQTATFSFQRDMLIDVSFRPDIGDILSWNHGYFEINSTNENQLVAGDYNKNWTISCDAVLTRLSTLNFERTRAF